MKDYLNFTFGFGTAFLIAAGFTYLSYKNVPFMEEYLLKNKNNTEKKFVVKGVENKLDSKKDGTLVGGGLSALFLYLAFDAFYEEKKKENYKNFE